jgi:hypothetical protein
MRAPRVTLRGDVKVVKRSQSCAGIEAVAVCDIRRSCEVDRRLGAGLENVLAERRRLRVRMDGLAVQAAVDWVQESVAP